MPGVPNTAEYRRGRVTVAPEPSATTAAARTLGTWLRTLRTATPADPAGAAAVPGRRRRLTQVEVARAAEVTPRAYQAVEQGHRLPGPRLIAGIAHALDMTAVQREYLRRLASPAPPTPASAPAPYIHHDTIRTLVAQFACPAFAYDRLWQVIATNDPMTRLVADLAAPDAPNLLLWFFTSPTARQIVVDWPGAATDLMGQFRHLYALHPQDPALADILTHLVAVSTEASALWDCGVVAGEPAPRLCRMRIDGHIVEIITVYLRSGGPQGPIRVACFLPPADAGAAWTTHLG